MVDKAPSEGRHTEGHGTGQDAQGHPVDKELDLRGEVCPYTFVKSKLALEPMASGQVLRVLVDYPPSAESVPRSMESEGHQVLHVGTIDGERQWEIVVQRA